MISATIHRSLEEAERKGDADALAKAHKCLKAHLERATSTAHLDLENLIYCAEVALKVRLK
jgi:hypothetical protein